MTTLALAALLRAKPAGPFWAGEWLESVLARAWGESSAATARAWSVGSVIGTETLVQSRPTVRDRNGRFLADMLRTPALATLCSYAYTTDSRASLPPLTLSRFRRFIGVFDLGQPLDQEGLAAVLPDFLSRARRDRSDRELAFLTFLAHLHRRGAMGAAYAAPAEIRGALASTAEELPGPFNALIHDGRTVGIVHGESRGTLLACEAPPEPGRRVPADGNARVGASLLAFAPGPLSEDLLRTGERVAPGVLSVSPARPLQLER